MAITLYHHPFSRAAGVVWTLEEIGQPYELKFVNLQKGEQKATNFLALNAMGKVPVLVDGDAVVTESAAIALYLADRYALNRLAPALDDPRRGTYLRWTLFAPSVIEPGTMAKASSWAFKSSSAGFGDYDAMMTTIERAVSGKPYLLGDMFSIADVVFGGTIRYLTRFKMMTPPAVVAEYIARLDARPAYQRASTKNAEVMAAHGLTM
jgi:glutathione S-transferase